VAEKKQKVDKDSNSEPKSMHVKVHGPYKVYYDGPAESISAENDTGPFDILPQHHNFMTLLSTCDVLIRHSEKEEKIPVQRGVMHVKADEVIVFLDV
jgi:F0F1-type ATP synthase epsilon subunit